MRKFQCFFGHAQYKSGEILISGNIIIAFSSLMFNIIIAFSSLMFNIIIAFSSLMFNIIIAFSSLMFMETPNEMLVACRDELKNNCKLCFYREQPSSDKCHLFISDACSPTIDYRKLKLCRTQFERYLKQLVKFHQNRRW